MVVIIIVSIFISLAHIPCPTSTMCCMHRRDFIPPADICTPDGSRGHCWVLRPRPSFGWLLIVGTLLRTQVIVHQRLLLTCVGWSLSSLRLPLHTGTLHINHYPHPHASQYTNILLCCQVSACVSCLYVCLPSLPLPPNLCPSPSLPSCLPLNL